MQTRQRQNGMTLIGWVIVIALIGFFVLLALRLTPVYIEAYSVGSILSGMKSEGAMVGSDRREIRQTFGKRLSINDVDAVTEDDLQFTDVAGGTQVLVEYESRVPFIANLSLVAEFRKEAVIRN